MEVSSNMKIDQEAISLSISGFLPKKVKHRVPFAESNKSTVKASEKGGSKSVT